MNTRLNEYKKHITVVATLAALIMAGLAIYPGAGRAEKDKDDDDNNASQIQVGFRAAPVTLNLAGKNRGLVGLGSYLVNVAAECNGCHSAGPQTEYIGNPACYSPPRA